MVLVILILQKIIFRIWTRRKWMKNIGMIIREDINQYFVENVKTKTIDVVEKAINNDFKVTEYIAYSKENKTLNKTYKYNSLPANSIITDTDQIDGLILFSEPFHIVGCLSEKEAELGFNEFFQKSSCNFVSNLKYIENEDDGYWDVTGHIGLYYNEGFADESFIKKFNDKFNVDVQNVRQNLEKELAVIENEKAVIKVSHNLFLFAVIIVSIVMVLGVIFKH